MTAVPASHDLWFRTFQPATPGGVRLLCLAHAGGSASYFLPLARALAPAFEVVCAQYPGRQDRRREPAIADIGTLADRLLEALRFRPGQRLVLFGHSMGAVLAYELARRLENRRDAPLGLIASGRRSPSWHRTETVHLRDDDGIIAEIRRLRGTDPGVLDNEELLRMALPALRSDYRAVETYRHRPGRPLRTPITVFVGTDDPHVTPDEARAWRELTAAPFGLRSFPGGHFYLNGWPAAVTEAVAASIASFDSYAACR